MLLLFIPFRQQVKIHAKFALQMDFYLQYICFRTDLAVNAKSCMNSNELVPKKYGSCQILLLFYNISGTIG